MDCLLAETAGVFLLRARRRQSLHSRPSVRPAAGPPVGLAGDGDAAVVLQSAERTNERLGVWLVGRLGDWIASSMVTRSAGRKRGAKLLWREYQTYGGDGEL